MSPDEFDAFYKQSFPRLVRQVYALCGDVDEASDCVQEAFVRAWAQRRVLDVEESPEAWVRTTARRLAVSRWRRMVRGRRAADQAMLSAEVVPPVDPDHLALMQALDQLPLRQREALVLHYLVDLPVAEVAAEVGAKVGTVKARLSRGRAALMAVLADDSVEGARHA